MTKAERECKKAHKEFQKVRDFSKEIPYCIWNLEITLPDPPVDPTTIANYGLPKVDRKFPYHSREYIEKIDSLPRTDQTRKDFIDEEWRRRREGFWWYNGDKLEWINGHYYMTLQYWLIPIEDLDGASSNPKFVDMQRDLNLAIWWCKQDMECTGLAYVGTRRSGKTAFGLANGYWDTTEKYNAHFGIQSKTDPDAKDCLLKLVASWQKLPTFLKPTDTGYTTVSRELAFAEPQRKDSKGKVREYKDVLNSRIYAYSSKERAMDGKRTTYQFQDEWGKREESDAAKTQEISKICCVINSKVVGFAFWATTVETMGNGDENKAAKKLWGKSDQLDKNENNRTKSTMYHLFFPAEYGMFEGDGFVDEWGYSNMTKAAEWLNKEEKHLEGEDLMAWKRKYPRNINEAFSIHKGGNTYNQRKLYEQYKYNEDIHVSPIVRGTFYREGGDMDGDVVFKPDPEGKCLVAWHPPAEDRNKYELKGSHRYPTREFCKIGCDPFSHAQTVDKGSLGAAMVILEKHYAFPKMKMAWVCQYLHRPAHPTEFYEDMIMISQYYSAHFLAENIKYDVLEHFHRRGYDGYCLYNPLDPDHQKAWLKGQRGVATTSKDVREAMMSITQAHIMDYIGHDEETDNYGFCPFNDLVSQWQNFEPDNWTPYDLAVAAGMTLIATKKPKKVAEGGYKPSDWFQKFNNKGTISRRM
jgi:hypothetical protein